MKNPHLAIRAAADLDEIWAYIARDNPLAADRLMARIFEALDLLVENPKLGRLRPDVAPDIRSYTVPPYLILYFALSDNIAVARVVHGSRDFPPEIDPMT
jgi:toxin ParE1/3/4